jgi:MHS family proline/betaine transporter-like MFS transporter
MINEHIVQLRKHTFAGVVGNLFEWYDFAVFGFLASVLSAHFFPTQDPLTGLIETYGVFAVGYLMRPLGGILFGHLGDRLGRKTALQLSMFLMAVPTVLIGLLPTYQQVGVGASIVLILLRLVQGISVGGELIGSVSFLVETAPPRRRGLQGSWSLCSAVGGLLLGSGLTAALEHFIGHSALQLWGWRLPFLLGFFVLLVGLWLRARMAESPEFLEAKQRGDLRKLPLLDVLTVMPGRVLRLVAIIIIVTSSTYMLFVWMPTYLGEILVPSLPQALSINTLAMTVLLLAIPVAGWLSDRFGHRRVILVSSVLMGLLVYPLFLAIDRGNATIVLAVQIVFALLCAGLQGPTPALMVEMFPPWARYSALGLGYNLTIALFGGTAPMVATWMIRETGDLASPAIYLVVLSLVSLYALWTLKPLSASETGPWLAAEADSRSL